MRPQEPANHQEVAGPGVRGLRPSHQFCSPCKEHLVSSEALPGGDFVLPTQLSELGEAPLGPGLSLLLENCPAVVELSNYISTVGW